METSASELTTAPRATLRKQLVDAVANARQRSADQQKLTVWLTAPFNLYLLREQGDAYLRTISGRAFAEQLYGPLEKLLDRTASKILRGIVGPVDFLDLGPGRPDRSLPLISELQRRERDIRYIPVDISPYFLDIATHALADYPLEIVPVHALFEELPKLMESTKLFSSGRARVVNLGLTFCNFEPHRILSLLQSLIGPSSVGVVATELIGNRESFSLTKPYESRDAAEFNFMMLRVIGLRRSDFEYFVQFGDHGIEMGFIARTRVAVTPNMAINRGDRIMTSYSYRFTEKQLVAALHEHFPEYSLFVADDGFVCVAALRRQE